ncbi:MAG TPA: hypothetical protein VL131_14445 [Gammaproteobacteria bacterium]|nr:hypothetical protein [Gammaproteobacteria bacterium]
MRSIKSTVRYTLFGAAMALAVVAQAQINDSIRGAPSEANHFIETPKGWKHPMTPWGEPDIQATLDMMQASGVPLERCANSYRPGAPPCDPNKKWLTEEEYKQRVEAAAGRPDRSKELAKQGNFGGALLAGLTDPNLPQRQTNLIVDPPNGMLPALTPLAKSLAYKMGSDWALPGENINFQSAADFDSWDRCVTRGLPSMMMPYRYNGGFRIQQAPGYVVFNVEMIHEARVIPTDGRKPLDSNVRQYLGESRGHWEGTTLVVETTNFRTQPSINQPLINLAVVGSPAGNRFPISDKLKTTERIVRLNDGTWLYEIKTEDPDILTAPFTVRYPMRNNPSYIVPEYACHEDNQIVHNYVTTNRYERAHPKPEPAQPPVTVSPAVADLLAGRWLGTPKIPTIDVNIELEFTKNKDGTVNGKLIGTNLGKIDKPLRNFRVADRQVDFTFPNVDPWSVSAKLTDNGTMDGIVFSIQGGTTVTFKKQR